MAIGIEPTVDYAFKRLLGNPEHPAITLHFLNAVLAGGPVIQNVEFGNPFLEKEHELDKLSILDIRATDEQGRMFNIEMQTSVSAGIRERLTYYAASLYVGQLGESDAYVDLRPTIGICVLDAVLFPNVRDLHHDFRLRTHPDGLKLTDRLQIHLLELPKYAVPSDNELISDPIDQWCYFFRQVSSLTAAELCSRLKVPAFVEAAGVLEMIAKNPRERELYEARLKLQRDEQARLQAAKDQGQAEGKAAGIAEGERIGEQRGRIEGKIEQLRMLEDFLGTPPVAEQELASMSYQSLSDLVSELQQRFRNRS